MDNQLSKARTRSERRIARAMNDNYRRLLAEADVPGCYEFPTNFNYESLEHSAKAVDSEIRRKLKEKTRFEGIMHNQDASFSIAIFLEDRRIADGKVICEPSVRFSNFGRLVTICSLELLDDDEISILVTVLECAGFHYIPEDILDSPYDGVLGGDANLPTWWVRYFEWL
jgi:hypothetical protein